jgi:hypothetical protein
VRAIYENAVALDHREARQRIDLEKNLTEAQRKTGILQNQGAAYIARKRDSFTLGTLTHAVNARQMAR